MEKKNVFVVGCNGKMGRIVCDLVRESEDLVVTHGFDLNTDSKSGILIQNDCSSFFPETDVIIDFSKPKATMAILPIAVKQKIPMVIATTGFTPFQMQAIEDMSKETPIFFSNNMAYSTKLFVELVRYGAKLFKEPYEISIHEIHHSGKSDAPSGTAKNMLFTAVNEAREDTLVYRFDSNAAKAKNEVWVSSERVGCFRGEHIVTIAGANDYVQLKHSINDRGVFAEGALHAARYLMEQKPGFYTMNDLFNE